MVLFDNRKAKVSLAFVITGGFVLCLLVTISLVIRAAIHHVTTSRLVYSYPPGYSSNPDLQWCYERTDGQGKFIDEYYMWNLTNVNEVLAGGNANYTLVGPYVYANWTCDFDWETRGDFLYYRTIANGFRFLPSQSVGPQTDKVTNVNPAYLALLKATGSEAGIIAVMTGGALRAIITTLQQPTTIAQVQALGRPTVLANMNTQLMPVFAAGVSLGVLNYTLAAGFPPGVDDNTKHNVVFNNPSSNFPVAMLGGTFRGYANFINNTYGVTPTALSNSTMNQLLAAWSVNGDGSGIVAFVQIAQANITVIVVTYNVDPMTANYLTLYAARYLMNPQSISFAFVQAQFYGQWANGTLPQITLPGGLKGWELGIPVASGLSASTVATLFNPAFQYSLTNDTVGANFWVGAMQGNVTLPTVQALVDPSITQTQFAMILGWLYNYQTVIVPPLLLQKFNITNWNDFAFAQWGSLVLGKSVGPIQHLTYNPEVSAFDPTQIGYPPSCVKYTPAEAKALLNGTNPLLNPTQTSYFLSFAAAKNYPVIYNLYGLDQNKTDCLYAYLTTVLGKQAVIPGLNQAMNNGSGMFVTRSIQEWLFTGQDPLLALLGQNPKVSLVGNNTADMATVMAQDKLYKRIYTGKNDLYEALQPPDYGSKMHGFWAEDITVVGYNGSQFMPYDYVKDPASSSTLQIWHRTAMRPVKLKYYGMTTWEGMDLAYLAVDPADLASEYDNPVNAKYFAQYGGLINESSFVTNNGLPVFLSLPEFNLADKSVMQNMTLNNPIFDPLPANPSESLSRHRFQIFVLVEPYLGASLWGNVPIQANFRYGPTDKFYTQLKPNFAPMFWKAIGDKGSDDQISHLKDTYYKAKKISKTLLGIGCAIGGILIVLGVVGLIVYRNKYSQSTTDDRSQNSKL